MGTTFQAYGAYDFPNYEPPHPHLTMDRTRGRESHYDMSYYARPAQSTTYSTTQAPTQPLAAAQQDGGHKSYTQAPVRAAARPQPRGSPASNAQSLIYHSMHIPSFISANGGDMVDLVSNLTCLFWFESSSTLKVAENVQALPKEALVHKLINTAIPTEKFRAWARSILSTTQVTRNVALLALLFVFRLRKIITRVNGGGGSEYRLLTVALMLANKFLDDNTYTNKTWAEVSNIPVAEVHVMEVEFLSNMRYGLLVSKEEWDDWLVKLSRYHEYYQRATTKPISPVNALPTIRPQPYLPQSYSPPASQQSVSPTTFAESGYSQPYPQTTTVRQDLQRYGYPPVQAYAEAPQLARPVLHQSYSNNSRKRSRDEDIVEPPPKRAYHTAQAPQEACVTVSAPPMEHPRLVPRLSIQTPQPMASTPTESGHAPYYVASQASGISLPPLSAGASTSSRAMSSVYPATSSAWTPPVSVNTSITQGQTPTAHYMPPGMPNHPIMHHPVYDSPSKRLSPTGHALTPTAYNNNSSPLTDRFPSYNATLTPLSQSPSFYLQQRNSPYKPIRNVRTLLYPPPSASLQEYHLGGGSVVPPNQMHYQPLGQRGEYRTGIVPEFRSYHPSGQSHQGGADAAVAAAATSVGPPFGYRLSHGISSSGYAGGAAAGR